MDINQRIAQWENMAEADAENPMGWFSLGNAYKDADRLKDAADALQKAVDLDASYSRAYQLLGQVLIALDQKDRAIEILTQGYVVAGGRGDVMPQKGMGDLLEKLGQPLPQVAKAKEEVVLTGEQIVCKKTGSAGTKMSEPPMKGPLGAYIAKHYCQETWREWIGQGTKVINELRLDFSNEEHQKTYEQQMLEWLGITPEDLDQA